MFGNNLKKLRNRADKTQENIAKILGISRAAYSHIENAETNLIWRKLLN